MEASAPPRGNCASAFAGYTLPAPLLAQTHVHEVLTHLRWDIGKAYEEQAVRDRRVHIEDPVELVDPVPGAEGDGQLNDLCCPGSSLT